MPGIQVERVLLQCSGRLTNAIQNTENRSALRIVRESELLGSELVAYHSRENLVIGAKFIRDDLPYFLELLAEVAGKTKYQSTYN